MKLFSRHVIAVSLLSLSGVTSAEYAFTTGAEFTTGDYGMSLDTDSLYIPLKLEYFGKKSAFSVTVPYISVSGSTQVSGIRGFSVPGPGGVSTTTVTTTSTEERTDSGLGDVVLTAGYQLQPETQKSPWLMVTGKVKLATADEDKNLGTGENDYAVQLEAAQGAVDGLIGYHVLGDTSTVNFDNIFFGAVAYTMPLKKSWKVRAELYGEQAALGGADPVREFNVAFSKPLSKERSLRLYLIKGLSDASPDLGAGVMIRTKFQ